MTTLILSPRHTPDSAALWRAGIQSGWSVERLQSHRVPSELHDHDLVIYGEALFVNIVAEQLGIVLLEPTFDWLTSLPSKYLQRSVKYSTLAHARNIRNPTFIKPAYDKSFDAAVYASGSDLPSGEVLPDELPILMAEPVVWEIEFRCFVLNQHIETLSIYSRNTELAQTEDGAWFASDAEIEKATIFGTQLLTDDHIHFPPAFVLDIGRMKDRGWGVIEANPAWASGIYGCDPLKILPVIQRACIQQEQMQTEDHTWVLERTI